MKNLFYFFLLLLVSCVSKDKVSVEIKNPSDFDRQGEIIELNLVDLSTLEIDSTNTYLVYDKDGNLLPSQVTYDGKLLFQSNLRADATELFTVKTGDKQEYRAQTFGRCFPERKDDFSWENDKVGFRLYGQALKKVQEPTNGLDLWYKRTSELVLNKWYENDISGKSSYHKDNGEGCDPYSVGTTLGAGAIAPYVDGNIVRNENYESYEILDSGPLRITFRLKYPDLKISENLTVKDEKTISLDAGSQLTKIVQDYGDIAISIAAGIVKRSASDRLIVSNDNTYLIYQEPSDNENGQIFLSLVFPGKFDSCTINTYEIDKNKYTHSLAVKDYKKHPISYYTGFGWDKFGFNGISDFEKYIQNFKQKIQQPLIVTIK